MKRYVELSGGRVWVESVPGTGTAFRFTLPFVACEHDTMALVRTEERSVADVRGSAVD